MTIRLFKFPEDSHIVIDLLPAVFGEAIANDQRASLINTMQAARRLAPLIHLLKPFMPTITDSFAGIVWEEEGQAVGLLNVARQGRSGTWRIGNFAILPDHRRFAAAYLMIVALRRFLAARGAKKVFVEVLVENQQMMRLCQQFGGQQFSSSYEFTCHLRDRLVLPALPDGYNVKSASPFAWRDRYALAKRITPSIVQDYTAVEESSYRFPAILQPLMRLYFLLAHTTEQNFVIVHGDQVVATGYSGIIGGGAGSLSALIDPSDPKHAVIADFLIARLANQLIDFGLQQNAYIVIPDWQPALIEAVGRAGFQKLREYRMIGADAALPLTPTPPRRVAPTPNSP